jgi:hypothetical protein
MGNVFINKDSTSNTFNKNQIDTDGSVITTDDTTTPSLLGNYIENFFKNRYKYPGSNSDIDSNFIKKRACCMNNEPIPISLPSWDQTNQKIVPTVLKMSIFDDDDFTTTNCRFSDGSYKQVYSSGTNDITNIGPNHQCRPFMSRWCGILGDDRRETYPKPPDEEAENYYRYYGPYFKNKLNRSDNENWTLNAYPECNCENSIFADASSNIGSSLDATGSPLTKKQMAQNFDKQCRGDDIIIGRDTWIRSYDVNPNLCVNLIAGNLTATEDGIIELNQTCNIDGGGGDGGTTPTGTTTTKPGTTTTKPGTTTTKPGTTTTKPGTTTTKPGTTSPKDDSQIFEGLSNQTFYIILGVCGLILLIILIILMMRRRGGRRRRRYYDDY